MRTLELEVTARDGQSYQVAARSDVGDVQGVMIQFPLGDRELERQLGAVKVALLQSAATTRRVSAADEHRCRSSAPTSSSSCSPPRCANCSPRFGARLPVTAD